jgi:hypothetical protein
MADEYLYMTTCWSNGILWSMASAIVVVGLGVVPILRTNGFIPHLFFVSVVLLASFGFGILGSLGRFRVLNLFVNHHIRSEEAPQCG